MRVSAEPSAASIEPMLMDLRLHVAQSASHLLQLFDVFANEARFAHRWISPNLKDLHPGDRILEVGAGLALVSCQLVKDGYCVAALEDRKSVV